jgi:hypothetical protein
MSANTAWELLYKDMDEFSDVVFDQFKLRLRDHRCQVKKTMGRSKHEEQCLKHDRSLFPRKLTDEEGVPNFDLHPAKELLRADVKAEKHKQMKPIELWKSRPYEYMKFEEDYFRNKIYQTVRREKFIYYLQQKREEKKLDYCKPPLDPTDANQLRMERQNNNANKRNKVDE